MILIIDNYDSFTYNLVQLVGKYNTDIKVVRNNMITLEKVKELMPSHIIISPGPGYPENAGICEEIIAKMKDNTAILGICLGHQAICEVFGGKIILANELMHGKQSDIHIANGSSIFRGLAPIIKAARYHSLIVKRESLPDELLVIAEDEKGEVMAVKHKDYEIYGLQFHPESILTEQGDIIIENFLNVNKESEFKKYRMEKKHD